jgi:hypothetical protein
MMRLSFTPSPSASTFRSRSFVADMDSHSLTHSDDLSVLRTTCDRVLDTLRYLSGCNVQLAGLCNSATTND